MKFKSKSKGSSGKESKGTSHRTSRAADEHLDEEIEVWGNDSFTSVASSVTAPPSQTASFYKRVQNDFDFSSSDESESLQDGQTNRSSDDDNLSWADNRSRDSSQLGGGDSQGAVKKPSKKDKKKKFRKGRRKFFGGGAIQEDHDGENEDAPKPAAGRRGRRLSLFGNSGHSAQVTSDQEFTGNRSTDGEFSVNQSSDDGCPLSHDGSHDGRNNSDSGAQAISRGRAKRRGSLGGYFSRKENQTHPADDVGHMSQDGSKDDLGYEDAAPSISREKPKRRGSLGGLFTKKEHNGHQSSDDGGHLSNDEGPGYGYEDAAPSIRRENTQRRGSLGGHFAKKENQGNCSDDGHGPLSQDGSTIDDDGLEYGYEDAAPVIKREKTKRRGSLGGLFQKGSRHSPPPPDAEVRHDKPQRIRRNSLFGGTEHTSTVSRHDQPSVNEQSTAAASTALSSKAPRNNRRRHSLTGGSSKNAPPPKDPHWIINQERKARGMPLFERSLLLDTLARSLSTELAAGLPPTATEFYGNVGRGKSLQMIHDTIMDDRGGISRKNILSEKFTEFGVALTQGNDGQFYMVALFK